MTRKNPFAMSLKGVETARLNSSPEATDSSIEIPPAPVNPAEAIQTDLTGSPQPIGEFAGRPDFPQCAIGAHVDIGGRTGIVIQVVGQSLKVKSPQGVVQSFNSQTLRKLYGPVIKPEIEVRPKSEEASYERPRVIQPPKAVISAPEDEEVLPEVPLRVFIAEPDFDLPIKSITEFVDRADFPKCAYGEHVEIAEFTGVVVEIVKQSLKVRAIDGYLRSYNGPILRKLYGKGTFA